MQYQRIKQSFLGILYLWADYLRLLFGYIFPEYPNIGIGIAVVSLLLFLFYVFRSGFFAAIKLAITGFLIMTVTVYLLHHIIKVLHLLVAF